MQKILFRLSKSAPTACIAALRMKSQVNMNSCLKILLLEDVQDDTLLIERELERAGIAFTWRVVGDRASFCAALCEFQPDVILCDHALPDFNSIEALHVAQERQKERGIVVPFILVTGNVSEEFAIQSMKAGVNDYIIKDRLRRLPHAIQGAIEKCKIENERLQYLREVVAKEALMSEAENLAHFGSWQIDLTTGKQTWSDSTYRIYGFKPREVEPTYELFISLVHPDDADPLKERLLAMRPDSEGDYEFRIIDKQGNLKYLSCKVHIHRQDNGTPFRVVGFNLDVTARKHAEQALARREQEYRSLFDHHPEAVFSLDLHAKFTNANREVVHFTGETPQELSSRDFREFIHPDDAQRSYDHFKKCLDSQPQRFRARFLDRHDKEAIIDLTFIPIVVGNEIIGVHGVAKDITRKKELERMLEEAYRQSRIGSWEVMTSTRRVTWSRITQELFEVDATYQPTLDEGILFFPEGEDREAITRAVEGGLRNGERWDVEARMVSAKGNMRWVRSVGQGHFVKGKCIKLFGTLQDIHERKTAELRLKEAHEEKLRILESIGDGFFTVDRQWTITYWNRQAEKLMGRPRALTVGRNLWDIYADMKDLAFYQEARRAMTDSVTVNFTEYYPPQKMWLRSSVYPSASGLSIYFKDITEQLMAGKKAS